MGRTRSFVRSFELKQPAFTESGVLYFITRWAYTHWIDFPSNDDDHEIRTGFEKRRKRRLEEKERERENIFGEHKYHLFTLLVARFPPLSDPSQFFPRPFLCSFTPFLLHCPSHLSPLSPLSLLSYFPSYLFLLFLQKAR